MQESKGIKRRSYVCVYLILREENKILLSLRKNTKFEDGKWALVAGHVEENESATNAMIREAEEEANIKIRPENLNVVYVIDRINPCRQNIDIFFECSQYSGELLNNEPHKCGGLSFFDINSFPSNTIDFIKQAILDIENKKIYREFGYNR